MSGVCGLAAGVDEVLQVVKDGGFRVFRFRAANEVLYGGVEGLGYFKGFIGAGKVFMAPVGVVGGKGKPSLACYGFNGHLIGLCQFFDLFIKVDCAHVLIIGKKYCFFAKKLLTLL